MRASYPGLVPGLSFHPPGFSPYRGAGRKESSGTGLTSRALKTVNEHRDQAKVASSRRSFSWAQSKERRAKRI